MDLMVQQLIPETIDINQNGDGLILCADGEELHIDHIVRCFPFSTPDQWISLRDRDGTELGLLPTLDGLNPQSRALIEEHLKDRYDIPKIQTILNIESNKEGGTDLGHRHPCGAYELHNPRRPEPQPQRISRNCIHRRHNAQTLQNPRLYQTRPRQPKNRPRVPAHELSPLFRASRRQEWKVNKKRATTM